MSFLLAVLTTACTIPNMKTTHHTYKDRATHCTSPLAKRLLQLMDDKQTNLALSADVTTAKELLRLADLIGSEICVLKTHIDIINDFTPDLTQQLRKLADKHQFLIFEDRKFADIGNTVKHQYEGGVYRIAEWADIVNAHSLPGPGIVEGLAEAGLKNNRGLLMLAEMSSAGNLLDKNYVQHTLRMAQQYPDFVIGFITQHALSDEPHWINMTPGVKLEGGTDKLGQRYVTPDIAIREHGSDIIIVGRGILAASDPLAEARKYREAGWQAYSMEATA
jgi:uridine monophosphate synthetase